MTDQPGDPIRRVEDLGDRLRVVAKCRHDLDDHERGSTSVLTREYEDLFAAHNGPDRVRIGTAAHIGDTEGNHIHGANGIYAEVPLTERELTDAEIEWCESTFIHGGSRRPETVCEFEIPHPEDLRSAIRDQDLDRFDCLDAVIADADHRHRVLTTLQEEIEHAAFRARKLHPRRGHPIDLDSEWDPGSKYSEDRDREHLYDMAWMRKDAQLGDFRTIAGFGYRMFTVARERIRGVHAPAIDDHRHLVALDVVGADDWSYCRQCAAVAPAEQFLHVQRRGRDEGRTMRVCDNCADRAVEFDMERYYTAEAVAEARDERAQRLGGQRRIGGTYEG
ncbi:hypothetical protein [Halostella litorea]|uniref:hypothetical protein n=1 Tax=Halostella litorea TaxID=2528831 RepID=UPI00109309CD|nr:hypothetical protein [Halostella litorea]